MRRYLLLAGVVLMLLAAATPASAHRWRGVWWGVHWGPWWGWQGWTYSPGRALDPSLTVVDTDISPERALVYLDGELIGTADDFDGFPDYLYLEPGRYVLEFKLTGYKPESFEIEAEEGRFFPLKMKMERVPGERVEAWYKNQTKGLPTRRVFAKPQAAPESVARRGPDPSLRRETRGEEREPQRMRASREAALDLRVSPPNAAVFLDGELVGTAEELSRLERGLAVAAGEHDIEIMAPGKKPRSIRVAVEAGERQQVVVELDEIGDGEGARQDDEGTLY